MKILFLDQTAKLGGAELVLLDIAKFHREHCLVGLFEDGPFKQRLAAQQIPVQVLADRPMTVRRQGSLAQGLQGIGQLIPLVTKVAQLSRNYDVIYANTLKALVVGALASALSGRSLVFHLHDILSHEHFSPVNCQVVVTLANWFAKRVIAVSYAAQDAFIAAGGRPEKVQVIYNGYEPERYQFSAVDRDQMRQQLGLGDRFLVGHFSRLSPWKGQHILIAALTHCPAHVTALLVGDALFGEQDYVHQLHQQVAAAGLQDRVKFLGFRDDVPLLMSACDLVTHTSTLPEPAGRVLVEAMLCGRLLITVQSGGPVELAEQGKTAWFVPPGDPSKLAEMINHCLSHPEQTAAIAQQAQKTASQRFDLQQANQQIAQLLDQIVNQSVGRRN
jgi:glycosyltransferase involved in cell wall biosynthesis